MHLVYSSFFVIWLVLLAFFVLDRSDARELRQFWANDSSMNVECLDDYYEDESRQLGLLIYGDGRILKSIETEMYPRARQERKANRLEEILISISGCPRILSALTDTSGIGPNASRYIIETIDRDITPRILLEIVTVGHLIGYIELIFYVGIISSLLYLSVVVWRVLGRMKNLTSGTGFSVVWNLVDGEDRNNNILVALALWCLLSVTILHSILIYVYGGITNAPVSFAVGYSLIFMAGIVARRDKERRASGSPWSLVFPHAAVFVVCLLLVGYSVWEAYRLEGAARAVLLAHYAKFDNLVMSGVAVLFGAISQLASSGSRP